jgi:uncharacterized protein (DUF983 family)
MSGENRSSFRRAWDVFVAIVRQRCPRCHRGRIFRGVVTMNDPCPECGLIFEREEGYFLGAMYVSYGMSVILIGGAYLLARTLRPGAGTVMDMVLTLALYLPFVPFVFRMSRVLWIYFDRTVCPSEVSAGAYEKMRLKERDDAISP